MSGAGECPALPEAIHSELDDLCVANLTGRSPATVAVFTGGGGYHIHLVGYGMIVKKAWHRGNRIRFSTVPLGIFLAVGVQVASAQESPVTCRNAPMSGTWAVDVSEMEAPGAPRGMGGGLASVEVTVEDCGRKLTAVFPQGRVVFIRFGPDQSMDHWWAAYLSAIGATKVAPPGEGYYQSARRQVRTALFPGGDAPDYGDLDPPIYWSTENTIVEDPRIFWLLSHQSPRHLRSVVGFVLVSERGADPSPPHIQFQDWRLPP